MRKLNAAILFLVAATTAHADWKLTFTQSESSPAKGLEHRHLVLEDSATGERASIELALFSTKSCRLRVVDQPDGPRVELSEAMRQAGSLAGVNGGYFDLSYAPIGLLVADGKIIVPLQRSRLLTGVLTGSASKVQIWRFGEFPRQQKIDVAVECGPMLVDHGKSVRGLEATRSARRTFAAVAADDYAALGFCSDATLADLSEILAAKLTGDFNIQRAINLDGGSSSAFWFKRENESPFSIAEQKTVRDFVAVVPR